MHGVYVAGAVTFASPSSIIWLAHMIRKARNQKVGNLCHDASLLLSGHVPIETQQNIDNWNVSCLNSAIGVIRSL